ncbi:MAG: hypothetical protein V3U14_12840 [candidate division NC10 bacterium]
MTNTKLQVPSSWHEIFSLLSDDPEKVAEAADMAELRTREMEEHINAVPLWAAFTPVFVQGVTLTLSSSNCAFMQIGDLVIVTYRVVISSTGTANNVLTTSLPVDAADIQKIGGSGGLSDGSASDIVTGVAAGDTVSRVWWFKDSTTSNIRRIGNDRTIASPDGFFGFVVYEAAA